MGRQVYTYIKDPQGNIVWSSTELEGINCEHEDTYFCGRNKETSIIAMYADRDSDEVDITKPADFNRVRDELQAVQDELDKLYNRLEDRIDALRNCRANASSLNAFDEFDVMLNDAYETLDDTYWNRGNDMIQLMQRTRSKAESFAAAKQGFVSHGDLDGYTIYWRNDE